MGYDEHDDNGVVERIHDAVWAQLKPLCKLLMAPEEASNYGLHQEFVLGGETYEMNFAVQKVDE